MRTSDLLRRLRRETHRHGKLIYKDDQPVHPALSKTFVYGYQGETECGLPKTKMQLSWEGEVCCRPRSRR